MKIDPREVPPDGLNLAQDFSPQSLELDTEVIKFNAPVKVRAQIAKLQDNLLANLEIKVKGISLCSRCLEEFELELSKEAQLSYALNDALQKIDLDPDIREEIILDYPIKPLCKEDCRGLCPACGKNLNQGGCNCGPA